jgi:flagellar basal-body rod protein FlgG
VESEDETYYTRAGDFQISYESGKYYLVTSGGGYVLDDSMKRVTFDELPSELTLTGPSQETAQENGPVQLAVVTFPNPYALQNVGGGLFAAGDLTGKSEINYESTVQQGCLERSSVDIIYEMTKMMEAQKGFQFSSKVIQAADELENLANSLRG